MGNKYPFGLDLDHDFIGKHRVISHQSTDARWWGIKYTERAIAKTGKDVADLNGNVSENYPQVLHLLVWIMLVLASDIFLEFQRAMKL